MTLILNVREVEELTDMGKLVAAVERGVREEAAGQVILPPRMNLPMEGGGFFRVMPALMNGSGLMGFKVFHGGPRQGVRYLIAVYEQQNGELLALMDGHYLTAARTGATSGVATKYMANPDASTVGIIGSGLEARTNLMAVCAVRKITRAKVFSPNSERRARFAERMKASLGIDVTPANTPEEAVRDTEIVVVGTNTMAYGGVTAFSGRWMQPGMHVNSIGSTAPQLREIDADTFANAGRIVVDSAVQVVDESGDVIAAIKEGKYPRSEVLELKDVVGGNAAGRANRAEITLFKSVGTGVQDVMAGFAVYEEALKHQRGRDVGPFLDVKRFGS